MALAPLAALGMEETLGLRMSSGVGPGALSHPEIGTQRPREGRDSPRGTRGGGLPVLQCCLPTPGAGGQTPFCLQEAVPVMPMLGGGPGGVLSRLGCVEREGPGTRAPGMGG